MKEKRLTLLWSLSLLVISLATLVIAGSRLLSLALPDWAIRLCGVLDLLAIPLLVYTSLRRKKK